MEEWNGTLRTEKYMDKMKVMVTGIQTVEKILEGRWHCEPCGSPPLEWMLECNNFFAVIKDVCVHNI